MIEVETIASGFRIPEGPIAMNDGSLLIVEVGGDSLLRILPGGKVETVAVLGGGPNGAAIGPDGAVYVCNNGGGLEVTLNDRGMDFRAVPSRYQGGRIERVDLATGGFKVLYAECDGKPLQGPNDIVFDRQGGFWFTDLGRTHEDGRTFGALYHALPDGSRITRWRSGLISPNGIGLSPDERTLYWSDSFTGRLWRCAVASPGVLADTGTYLPGEVVCTLPGYQILDSMAVEAAGKVCVGTIENGGITVFDPDGTTEHVALPDAMVTNICFGGPDMQTAWITAAGTGRVLKARWPRPGLKLNFNA
jgi:gluconolactonase